MAQIVFDFVKAKSTAQKEVTLERTLSSLSQEVIGVRSNLRFKIAGREQISDRLRQVSEQITRESSAIRAMSSGLQLVIGAYERTENANRDGLTADTPDIHAAASGGGWQEIVCSPEFAKAYLIPLLVGAISPVAGLLYITSGIFADNRPSVFDPTRTASASAYGDWLGYEFSDKNPGITAWIGKAHAEAQNEWGSAEVNGYIGKAKAEAKADLAFLKTETKKKYVDGKWTGKETTQYVQAEVSAGAAASILAGDAKAEAGTDMLGIGVKAEGGIGNAEASGKAQFSIGDDGVNALLSGKALVSAAEGKASGTINILGFEITGKVGGYAGAVGVEGKVGFENNKFVMQGGVAAALGFSLGIEVGFNDEGWSNLIDWITFWD